MSFDKTTPEIKLTLPSNAIAEGGVLHGRRGMTGINIGDAAMHILNDLSGYGEHGPNIVQATARLDHIKATNAELREAVAYTALQANAYRRMSNQDAELAIRNIEHNIAEFRKRQPK